MKKELIYNTQQLPAILTIAQFANLVQISEVSVRNLCRTGKIPAIRIGNQWRIDKEKALKTTQEI